MNTTMRKAAKLIEEAKESGKTFTVSFVKKDKTVRIMNCRGGVKKHLKGGTQGYNPSDHNLITVFDMQKRAYRNINLGTIIHCTINGISYDVVQEQKENFA